MRRRARAAGRRHVGEDDDERSSAASIAALFPPDTLIVVPRALAPRAGAAAHVGRGRSITSTSRAVAARTCPNRDELFETPERRAQQLARFGRIAILHRDAAATAAAQRGRSSFRFARRSRSIATSSGCAASFATECRRSSSATTTASASGSTSCSTTMRRAPSPAALSIGVLDGGFVVAGRRAASRAAGSAFSPTTRSSVASVAFAARGRYITGTRRSTRSRRSSPATTSCISSTASASIAASRRSSSAQSTIEVAVIEYEGGDRLNVPLYRIDQLERYRSADDVSEDSPPPRLHKLGGKRWAQQRDKTRAAHPGDDGRAARSLRAAQDRDASAARARHAVAAPARVVVPVRGHARPAHGDDAR